jgi:hypothetical protein
VDDGYHFSQEGPSNVVFFPLYPLLIKSVGYICPLDPKYIGILLSHACLWVSVFLFDAVYKDKDRAIRNTALLLLLFNPCRIFYSAVYSESLFLMLLLKTHLFENKNQIGRVGLSTALLVLTRINGIFVFVVFLPDLWRKIKEPWKLLRAYWPLVLPALALLGMLSYHQFALGDFFAFTKAQATGWGRTLVFPLATLDRGMGPDETMNFFRALHHGALIVLGASIYFGWKLKYHRGWLAFMVCCALLALSSGRTEAFARFVSVLFPLYMIMAEALKERPLLTRALLVAQVFMGTFGIILYSRYYWFT